ncbi:MAG: hypothetical protein OK455_07365, partial [Thaumarchaeota archaeon]|nr:hypothetical protein [Nitrososphaerota archaeon]
VWTHFIPTEGYRGGNSNSGNIVFITLSSGDMLMLNAQTGTTLKDYYIGGPLNVLPSIGATASGQMQVILPITAGLVTWGTGVPGDIVALNLQNIPGTTTNTVTSTSTTTTTVAGGGSTVTSTTTVGGGATVTSTTTVGGGATVTSTTTVGGAGSTVTVSGAGSVTTSVTTITSSGGVSSTTLYGVGAVAAIFIIATGYLAMRGRKPAS